MLQFVGWSLLTTDKQGAVLFSLFKLPPPGWPVKYIFMPSHTCGWIEWIEVVCHKVAFRLSLSLGQRITEKQLDGKKTQ